MAFEGVVHFAAKAVVGESAEAPQLYYSNNTLGTAVLLQAMHNKGVRQIVSSSELRHLRNSRSQFDRGVDAPGSR